MTRNELDTKTVAKLAKLLPTKRGRKTISIVRADYNREMDRMGWDMMTAYHGFNDCCDMAELELLAA